MKLSPDFIISAAKVVTKCRKDKTFCVDDIRAIADRKGMDVKSQSWGMGFNQLQAQKRIKPVKMARSSRAANHGRKVNLWRLC